jgi:hypothetical protein
VYVAMSIKALVELVDCLVPAHYRVDVLFYI